jgi:hypothetical protein
MAAANAMSAAHASCRFMDRDYRSRPGVYI